MANFLNELKETLNKAVELVATETAKLVSERNAKVQTILELRNDIAHIAQQEKAIAKIMYETADKFEDLGEVLYDNAETSNYIVSVLDGLQADEDDEDEEGMLGVCPACGCVLYEEDEPIVASGQVFCDEWCQKKYEETEAVEAVEA